MPQEFKIDRSAYLVELEAPNDRSLRLVLEERTGLGPEEQVEDGLGPARAILRRAGDSRFEVSWPLLVCFAVRGDPFANDATPCTEVLSEQDRLGPFMQFVEATARTDPAYVAAMGKGRNGRPAPLRHWRVCCDEAVIDVAAPDPPTIRRLDPLDA